MDDSTRPFRIDRLAGALVAALLAGGASAAPPTSSTLVGADGLTREEIIEAGRQRELEPIVRLLDNLGADNLAVREQATKELIESQECRDATIVMALRTFALLPEQRARLVECLRQRFLTGPQNAIGVQMQPMDTGVLLTRVFPQFPASQVLMAGDAVIEIDGVSLVENAPFADRSSLMTRLILAHDRDTPLRVRLVRDGRLINLDVPLGSRRAFDEQTAVDEFTLQDAWRLRLERLGVDDGANTRPIVAAFDTRSDWLRARRVAMRLSSSEGLAPGGETWLDLNTVSPQLVSARPAPQVRLNVAPQQRAAPLDARPAPAPARRDDVPNPAFNDGSALKGLRAALEEAKQELARPNIQPERREELLILARGLEQQISALEGLADLLKKAAEEKTDD